MSAVLYYSNYCNHCKQLLLKLSRTKTRDDLHFVCIDKREKHKDGSINIILENGQRLLLPPNVKSVPTVLLLHHGNRVIDGLKEINHFLSPGEVEINNKATNNNGEPLAFSMNEMGSGLSDNYSYLDMSVLRNFPPKATVVYVSYIVIWASQIKIKLLLHRRMIMYQIKWERWI